MDQKLKQITSEQREGIAKCVHKLHSVSDFFKLLDEIIEMLQLSERDVTFYKLMIRKVLEKDVELKYRSFTIKKKSGKDRIIHAPSGYLKLFHRIVNVVLSSVFEGHKNAFGYRKGSSICSNAEIHVAKEFVFNVDLKDFFPSISEEKVLTALTQPPFNFSGVRYDLASTLSTLCTMPSDDSEPSAVRILPQGAPTSPLLSNLVCDQMDVLLTNLGEKFGAEYSRYADDITFSSSQNIFSLEHPFRDELSEIIFNQGFTINDKKTRLQHSGRRQVVTGLVVNEKLNVQRKFIKKLRMYLAMWDKYGYRKAEKYLFKDEKVLIDDFSGASLYTILKGRLNYLLMIKGASDTTYLNLVKRFSRLERKYLPHRRRVPIKTSKEFNKHQPKAVSGFLRYFQDSNALKYLTHDFDIPTHEFNYGVITDQALSEFNKAYEKFAVTPTLYARIKQFAFESNPIWWRWVNGKQVNYSIGWSSTEVQRWAQENPGIHPIRLKRFRDTLINPFKQSIQFRPPRLRSAIELAFQDKFGDDFRELEIEFTGLETAEFFTDVDIFLAGVRHLLDGILDRIDISRRIHIIYSLEEINGITMKVLKITHIDSQCFKMASSTGLLNGNFTDARKLFFGLCNWSIEGHFSNGCFRVNMLSDNTELKELEQLDGDSVKGFTHILTFY